MPEWIRNLFAALGVLALVGWIASTQLPGRDKPAPVERVRLRIPPDRQPAPVAEPPAVLAPRVVTREASTVYRCIVDGRVVYSGPNDCRGGMPQPVRIDPAPAPIEQPAGLTEYQREMLRSADARIARERRAFAESMAARPAAASSGGECAGLDATIRALDAEARGVLSAYRQDQIRAERQQVMSRRFALRC